MEVPENWSLKHNSEDFKIMLKIKKENKHYFYVYEYLNSHAIIYCFAENSHTYWIYSSDLLQEILITQMNISKVKIL